jgi:hypothetical protein
LRFSLTINYKLYAAIHVCISNHWCTKSKVYKIQTASIPEYHFLNLFPQAIFTWVTDTTWYAVVNTSENVNILNQASVDTSCLWISCAVRRHTHFASDAVFIFNCGDVAIDHAAKPPNRGDVFVFEGDKECWGRLGFCGF